MKKSVLLLILASMIITASACNGSDATGTMTINSSAKQETKNTEEIDFPAPDTAMLVNLRGDTTTVYKLADGRYMDRTNTVYTSWDSETGTYIPYQQADGNGEPIGRGNGWYYYDEESGAYMPW